MSPIISPRLQAREEVRQQIEREVIERYTQERAAAGFWRRLVITFKVQKEVAAELRRRFPPHALYGHQ